MEIRWLFKPSLLPFIGSCSWRIWWIGSLAQPQRFIEHAAGTSQMSTIANTRHIPHKEKPDEVIEIFSKFLKNAKLYFSLFSPIAFNYIYCIFIQLPLFWIFLKMFLILFLNPLLCLYVLYSRYPYMHVLQNQHHFYHLN